ncbi:beta-1,4-N-acetylgalactosaminyltransferase 3 [Kryptolebias marmoratus]|uniref:Beta-1,4-N-acetylgalactosaminyltransferase n=1 Tax=Kryptolebias marmoratus TaxID=37003 RepID=A0A3Q3AS51_KRYMA|nr:beta-1,4-N-acetylgalactosaminyltransferase 3 [Kryptolebias marmoratus]
MEKFPTGAKMIAAFFPLKKLRRYGKRVVFGAILLTGALLVAPWSRDTGMNPDADSSKWRRAMLNQVGKGNDQSDSVEDSATWTSSFTPQTWKPEFKGRANLHVFEDWCGSSIADLHRNLHYPLYPHSRTTVQKLAVSPQWTNYGLRIFGYLHPYADGDFVFALSSDDNSELWLSSDHSPLNVQLLAWVGKTGKEWTAPGEFEKYASQTSRPVRLSAKGRYFFEVLHKQNDRGTDHVEVTWQLLHQTFMFTQIESKHISLYVDESNLMMSDVDHIPQTAASHRRTPSKQRSAAADMLREDPRDAFYQVPLINKKFLKGVLPDCVYKPSYTIKDFPLQRYQGLQFVHMSYIYPNDYTRLTHMESENNCFYPGSAYYKKMFGFSRYMRLDRLNTQKEGNAGRDFGFQRTTSVEDEGDSFDNEANDREREVTDGQIKKNLLGDYGDDYDAYDQKYRRKLFSLDTAETNSPLGNPPGRRLDTQDLQKQQGKGIASQPQEEPGKVASPLQAVQASNPELEQAAPVKKVERKKTKRKVRPARRKKAQSFEKSEQTDPSVQVNKEPFKAKQQPAALKEQEIPRSRRLNKTQIQKIEGSQFQNPDRDAPLLKTTTGTNQWKLVKRDEESHRDVTRRFTFPRRNSILKPNETDYKKALRDKEIEMNMPLREDLNNPTYKLTTEGKMKTRWSDVRGEEAQVGEEGLTNRADSETDATAAETNSLWDQRGAFTGGSDDEDSTPAPVFDTQVHWNQTFQVSPLDLQAQRSDWIDLNCNISGNLLLRHSDAAPIVDAFMEQLNAKHQGWFTLVRVVNVVKRVDGFQGNRYLLDLELKDSNDRLLRLSRYIYVLIRHSRTRSRNFGFQRSNPQLVLCNPVGFHWNPFATVHFIVPVKNQARWVLQLIRDMEQLFRETGDLNFNLIITDYSSTDMDVRKALERSSLPRYQYVKLSGSFERSAGLQAGIDRINDDHSIVFLCDLHIHFPPSIIDTIRKHCVEGYMAFAPIVLRLGCGNSLLEARGYWEVNGFGLLGIYKSDLNAIGGMNTEEFKDSWGGEDWELLDRILQGGLEVERIHLRNFFHYHHSKRGMWNRQMLDSNR